MNLASTRDIHTRTPIRPHTAARTRYYYQVGDFGGADLDGHGHASPIFSVRTAPDAAALAEAGVLPLRVAVYGDMGVDKGKSRKENE